MLIKRFKNIWLIRFASMWQHRVWGRMAPRRLQVANSPAVAGDSFQILSRFFRDSFQILWKYLRISADFDWQVN